MRFDFDYPVTRAYPWRFTTLFVVLLSAAIFGGLVYVNLTIVGVAEYTKYSSTFEKSKSPSWTDRLRIGSISNYNLGCEPATLVTGGMYQTPNGAFKYTIQSLYDTVTSTPSSNANYNGSDLSNCRVDTISLSTNFASFEALLEASINCTLQDGVEFTATTDSFVRVDSVRNRRHTRDSATAANISRIVNGFGSDFFESVLLRPRLASPPANDALTALYCTFGMNTDETISWLSGFLSAGTMILKNPNEPVIDQLTSTSGAKSIENLLHALTWSIHYDLGATSQENPLTIVDTFKSTIQRLDWEYDSNAWRSFTGAVLSDDPAEYNMPFEFVKATHLNAQYQCRYISWKPYFALVVDVFVATASLFMVFWAGLNMVLRHFATQASPIGNNCGCANCGSPMVNHGNDPQSQLLTKYDPVPNTPTWSNRS